jgi:hypothetical protein
MVKKFQSGLWCLTLLSCPSTFEAFSGMGNEASILSASITFLRSLLSILTFRQQDAPIPIFEAFPIYRQLDPKMQIIANCTSGFTASDRYLDRHRSLAFSGL